MFEYYNGTIESSTISIFGSNLKLILRKGDGLTFGAHLLDITLQV